MKKILLSILLAITTVTCFCACGKKPNDSASGGADNEKMYTITYYAVEYGRFDSKDPVVTEINPLMFLKDGSYPTSYDEGEEVYISPLKSGLVDISDHEDREFKGWYADVTCTMLYSDVSTTEYEFPDWWDEGETYTVTEDEYSGIKVKASGDLIFYAKLVCGYWTGAY